MKQTFKKTILTLFIIALPFIMFAQSSSIESAYDTLNVSGQFDYLYKRSNTYEDYKVVRISSYNALKKNALDSISIYKVQVDKHLQKIGDLNKKINDQASEVKSLSQELEKTKDIQDSMSFVGANVSKSAYNSIMWGLVICLIALSAMLFSFYRRGYAVVKSTKKRLQEIQEELENHRKNALVREQKLARELMDVKLKHKSTR